MIQKNAKGSFSGWNWLQIRVKVVCVLFMSIVDLERKKCLIIFQENLIIIAIVIRLKKN